MLISGSRRFAFRLSPFPRYSLAMRPFLLRWILTTIAVGVAAWITGIRFDSFTSLAGASLLLGIINAFIRPVLLLLSMPFILLTLGLFILVINALMLWFVGSIVPGAHVDSFGQAFFGALIVSIVSWLLSSFFKASDGHYYTVAHHTTMKQVQGRVVDEPR
jgi:putative membrane protein